MPSVILGEDTIEYRIACELKSAVLIRWLLTLNVCPLLCADGHLSDVERSTTESDGSARSPRGSEGSQAGSGIEGRSRVNSDGLIIETQRLLRGVQISSFKGGFCVGDC